MKKILLSASILALATTFNSCDNNDHDSTVFSKTALITFENVSKIKDYVQSGTFAGIGTPPIILPGQSISFEFNAGRTQSLMFATMYGASKDWFFAPENPGIKLYDINGKAMTGDVSSYIKLWDNGSKDNSTGIVENEQIKMVPDVDASQLMKLSIDYNEINSKFTLTITNTSKGTTHETPFSPGAWAISNVLGGKLLAETPFYIAGEKSNPEITAIAEMGQNNLLAAKTKEKTGIFTSLSPVLVVIYQGDENPIFQTGTNDQGMGLLNIAQKGDSSKLREALTKVSGVKHVYIAGTSPIAPGQKAETIIQTTEGDKIAYVTMFGYSNDWFLGNSTGILQNLTGDLTAPTFLFDSGTGVDQYPGAGNKQAMFGGTPQVETKPIERVGNMFPVPPVSEIIKVTIK